jgi:hypothetical protein
MTFKVHHHLEGAVADRLAAWSVYGDLYGPSTEKADGRQHQGPYVKASKEAPGCLPTWWRNHTVHRLHRFAREGVQEFGRRVQRSHRQEGPTCPSQL